MEKNLTEDLKNKISLFCNVEPRAVIDEKDVGSSIYEVPLLLKEQKLDDLVLEYLQLKAPKNDHKQWREMVHTAKNPKHSVTIAVAGKYTELKDAYKSIWEALKHGGFANSSAVEIKFIDVESEQVEEELSQADGILVPGGFGDRGIEGKIRVVKCAVIEFARSILGFKDAHSTEFNPNTKHPVIDMMVDQKKVTAKGGTMRLGVYPCKLTPGSLAAKAYKKDVIMERHRHRYEYNNKYQKELVAKGLSVTGINTDRKLVEIVEIKGHPWFVGVQFHPEFQSRPTRPHSLFKDFITAALKQKEQKEKI
jgi:CTP synthase